MKRIGEILVDNNFISLDSLNKAIQEQQNSDKKLGEILIEKGYLNEDNLLKGYAIQTGSKPISENDLYQASTEVTKLIPEDFCKEKFVLAISKNETDTCFNTNFDSINKYSNSYYAW